MRLHLSEVPGYLVHGRDGNLGAVTDLYFDDVYWRVRYLSVTGGDKTGPRSFLFAPGMISRIDREIGWIALLVKAAAVCESPEVPAGRNSAWKEESCQRDYYGMPYCWPSMASSGQVAQFHAAGSQRLHSLKQVLGNRVLAGEGDEDIGPLTDLVVDDHTWEVQGIEVEAGRWLPTGRVWISAAGIRQVRGSSKQVVLGLPLDALLTSPTADRPGRLAQACAPSPWSATYCAGQLQDGGSVT